MSKWLVLSDDDGGHLIPVDHVKFATVTKRRRLFRRTVFILEINTIDLGWDLLMSFKSQADAMSALEWLEEAVETRGPCASS